MTANPTGAYPEFVGDAEHRARHAASWPVPDDLAAQLRWWGERWPGHAHAAALMREAADAIERLRAVIDGNAQTLETVPSLAARVKELTLERDRALTASVVALPGGGYAAVVGYVVVGKLPGDDPELLPDLLPIYSRHDRAEDAVTAVRRAAAPGGEEGALSGEVSATAVRAIRVAAWKLSTWAAAIDWSDEETNMREWLDGLRARIEAVQASGCPDEDDEEGSRCE